MVGACTHVYSSDLYNDTGKFVCYHIQPCTSVIAVHLTIEIFTYPEWFLILIISMFVVSITCDILLLKDLFFVSLFS